MTRSPALVLLAALFLLIASRPLIAESAAEHHIRMTDQRLFRLVHDGIRISGTFRRLVERIRHSDVIVYLESAGGVGSADGRLALMSSVGGYRYVHVRVATLVSADQQIALIGHELQHAVEIAEAPEIVDDSSLARAYARIGFANPRVSSNTSFDSDAAVEAGYRVLRELLGKDSAQLPTPNLSAVAPKSSY